MKLGKLFQIALITCLELLSLENAKNNFLRQEILSLNTRKRKNVVISFMNGQDVNQMVIHIYLLNLTAMENGLLFREEREISGLNFLRKPLATR